MKQAARSFLTVLFLGAFMALLVEQFAGTRAVALQPPVGVVGLLSTGMCACPGDTNGDNTVNIADLSVLLANFGVTCAPDNDGDGFPVGQDCDDNDPDIVPGAIQVCASGFPGVCSAGLRTCQVDGMWTACVAGIAPNSQPEVCNGFDDDCDGATDEGAPPCPAGPPNTTGNCIAGGCVYSCNAGFGNCDSNMTNGCERNLITDPLNCGACGNSCPFGPHVVGIACIAGQCTITGCQMGWFNANGIFSDGCESTTP